MHFFFLVIVHCFVENPNQRTVALLFQKLNVVYSFRQSVFQGFVFLFFQEGAKNLWRKGNRLMVLPVLVLQFSITLTRWLLEERHLYEYAGLAAQIISYSYLFVLILCFLRPKQEQLFYTSALIATHLPWRYALALSLQYSSIENLLAMNILQLTFVYEDISFLSVQAVNRRFWTVALSRIGSVEEYRMLKDLRLSDVFALVQYFLIFLVINRLGQKLLRQSRGGNLLMNIYERIATFSNSVVLGPIHLIYSIFDNPGTKMTYDYMTSFLVFTIISVYYMNDVPVLLSIFSST